MASFWRNVLLLVCVRLASIYRTLHCCNIHEKNPNPLFFIDIWYDEDFKIPTEVECFDLNSVRDRPKTVY